MRYVFLTVFILSSLVHLYASYRSDTKLRSITKPVLVTALIGYYCFSAQPVNKFVVAFLVFSLLGDIALMINGFFAVGGVCFGFGHLCLIYLFSERINLSCVSVPVIVCIAAVYIIWLAFLFRYLKEHIPKKLYAPMVGYLLTNMLMNLFAFMQLMSVPSKAGVLCAAGAALFFISDCILYTVRFHKNQSIFTKHFLVMLTYISAVFLITYGFIIF